jgi:hypothetical protein
MPFLLLMFDGPCECMFWVDAKNITAATDTKTAIMLLALNVSLDFF